jgi:hypothetical protein
LLEENRASRCGKKPENLQNAKTGKTAGFGHEKIVQKITKLKCV